MFIDRSEFSAHNQALVFHDLIEKAKKRTLESLGKSDILESFTIDSPVPFEIKDVVGELRALNEQMVQGSSGRPKQGDFYGQFSRLLVRINSKLTDRRYGFLYQAPSQEMEYEALHRLVSRLLGFGKSVEDVNCGLKVIDFSEVCSSYQQANKY